MAGIIDTLSPAQQLELVYIGYFNRAADGGGFNFWDGQYASAIAGGQSATQALNNIANSFTPQAETLKLYPILSTTGPLNPGNPVEVAAINSLITSVYQNLFDRAPDAAGQAYWANQILTGAVGLGTAILAIANGATGNDLTLEQNKISAALNFTTSTAGANLGLTAATTTSALLGEANSILGLVTTNPASVTTANTATTNFITSGGGQPVTTFTLTAGVDAPGTGAFANGEPAGDSVTYGTFNQFGVGTFSSGDTIKATGSNNTLNLAYVSTTSTLATVNVANTTVSGVQNLVISSGEAIKVDTTGFTGLTQVNVTSASGTGNVDSITAAATTNVTMADHLTANTVAALTVNGGATVVINEANGVFSNFGIAVNGGAGTTSVSVTQTESGAGKDGLVTVTDTNYATATAVGVIASVTLDGLGHGAIVKDSGLTNLTVNDVDAFQGVTISNGGFAGGATTLNLSLNNDATFTLVDASGASNYTALNVTTGAAASSIVEAGLTNVTAETISGSSVLTQAAAGMTALKTITVSGAAGLLDSDLNGLAHLTSVTDTSSGAVTVALNDTLTSFSGATATGAEVVTITQDATQAITGNGLAASEVVFDNAASTFTAANSGAEVTGFKVLGVGASGSGTFNMAAAPFNGFTSIDDQGTAGGVSFTNVAAGTALAIDAADGGVVTYQTADTAGASDSVSVTLGEAAGNPNGLAATTTAFTATSNLVLRDSALVGIGNVNVNVNDTSTVSPAANTVTLGALSDSSMSSLTISGTGDLTVTNTYIDNTVTSLSITDNATGLAGLTFAAGITANLGTLTLAGSNTNAMALGTLTDTATSLTVTDSYAGNVNLTVNSSGHLTTESYSNSSAHGVMTLGANTGAALSSLTLNGAVVDTVAGDAVTHGITVSGATDNSTVAFTTVAAGGAGLNTGTTYYSDSFTLGNGASDSVVDHGVGNITASLGNGAGDVVSLGNGAAPTTQTVTIGSGSGDTVSSGSVGTVSITAADLSTNAVGDSIFLNGTGVHATVTVGNANDSISVGGSDSVVTISAGTGANQILLATGTSGSVSLGAHTGIDAISVGANDTGNLAKIVTISGLNSSATTNDTITFTGDAGATGAVYNANADIANYLSTNHLTASLANDITAAFADLNLVQHGVATFNFNNTTYVVEQVNAAGTAFAAGDTVVALVGTVPLSHSSAVTGVLTLHG